MLTLSDEYIEKLKDKIAALVPGNDILNYRALQSVLRFDSRLEDTVKEWINGNGNADYVLHGILGIQEVMSRLDFPFLTACGIISACMDFDTEKIKYQKYFNCYCQKIIKYNHTLKV